ncbi:MAG TPA: glutamate--tRNA ligase [Candidatus Humimicrobiaceae bacterium]
MEIRLRFAPSPTGYLHIGSARTAFFNWLFAKKKSGKFILRIEDTDIERNREETVGTILDSMKWLGMDWDEGPDIGGDFGPYRQSQRLDIYKKLSEKMLEEGKAYICFCTPGQISEDREKALKTGKFYKYDRKCANLSKNEINRRINEGEKYSIRILVPQDKTLFFKDNVYGNFKINCSNIEDFILIRSNGIPTYNFSAAVDDCLMQISHIIRGEDHLSNTPKQLLIYDALNFSYPDLTHLPMILASDGQKLSKRHGSISIEAYRKDGFLPEAVLNYIALLGWAYDDKTTIFSVDEMMEKFELKSINKKAPKFDYEKLLYLNGYYIRNLKEDKLQEILLSDIISKNRILREKPDLLKEKLPEIIPITKERIKTITEFEKILLPFFNEVAYSDDAKNYFIKKDVNAKEIIFQSIKTLKNISDFSVSNIEAGLKNIAVDMNINFKKVAEVLRIAIWGEPVSPPLFETIKIIGREASVSRLEYYLEIIT